MDTTLTIIVVFVVLAVVFILLGLNLARSLYRKVGPNTALIVYGSKQSRVITNGGTFIVPIREQAEYFSLELMSFDVAPSQDLYSTQGVALNVEAVTQLKVRSDRESILTAAEQFLSKSDEQRESLIRLVMEGHLRGIVGQLTVEQIVKEPEMVSEKMRQTSSSDLTKMGLDVVSFTIKEVKDHNDYIANMGRPEIERIKKEANIAATLATREAAVVKSQADQAKVEAETLSQTKQAEFQRDLSLKKAAYDAETKKQQASADKAYDIQTNIMQQQVVTETTRVLEIEKTAQVKVQEAEIKRRELELEATVLKSAEADRKRIEIAAEADRQRTEINAAAESKRLSLEAEGRAASIRAQGAAEAEATRVKGLAEADVIRARGEAEAEAMRVKAAAYLQYNQAAVLDKLLTSFPEIVRALAEPLSKIDKVTIVSTGGSEGQTSLGASRLTGDVVNMLAQVPAMFEMLSGVKLEDLLGRIPGLHNDDKDGEKPAESGDAHEREPAHSSSIVDASPSSNSHGTHDEH